MIPNSKNIVICPDSYLESVGKYVGYGYGSYIFPFPYLGGDPKFILRYIALASCSSSSDCELPSVYNGQSLIRKPQLPVHKNEKMDPKLCKLSVNVQHSSRVEGKGTKFHSN